MALFTSPMVKHMVSSIVNPRIALIPTALIMAFGSVLEASLISSAALEVMLVKLILPLNEIHQADAERSGDRILLTHVYRTVKSGHGSNGRSQANHN